MVGKMKHVRQRLHQEAVKLDRPAGLVWSQSLKEREEAPKTSASSVLLPTTFGHKSIFDIISKPPSLQVLQPKSILKGPSSFPNSVFAGTRITPEALVQTLKFEEPSDLVLHVKKGGEETKAQEGEDEGAERAMAQHSIKLAREQQAAQARRQATPVVGDMKSLADALPELSELIGAPCAASVSAHRSRNRKNRVPADDDDDKCRTKPRNMMDNNDITHTIRYLAPTP
ncbi:hypothetical protein NHX12_015099 [Muraenolepis orangiensis]|uniref:Uncharacterized protein n=1 Tax=Muraenolepis orangiensis TaxID=630683 RepID=A0A9Q0I3J9_9TELE|nr:hypothetical protein NHX12_015099 [Muraenolepis orangiensis]